MSFPLAQRVRIDVHTKTYDSDSADRALSDLEGGLFSGAAVLVP